MPMRKARRLRRERTNEPFYMVEIKHILHRPTFDPHDTAVTTSCTLLSCLDLLFHVVSTSLCAEIEVSLSSCMSGVLSSMHKGLNRGTSTCRATSVASWIFHDHFPRSSGSYVPPGTLPQSVRLEMWADFMVDICLFQPVGVNIN